MPDGTNETPKYVQTFTLEQFWANARPRSVPPNPELVEAVKGITRKDVRDEALLVLYDDTVKIDGDDDRLYVSAPGLGGIARAAQVRWQRRGPKLKSPIALKKEFEELGSSMREVAGRLRMLSETARYFISMMPDYDMATVECRYQMDLWDEFNASEAFQSPFLNNETAPVLASRLDGIAKMLDSMACEAGGIAEQNPGARHVFDPPPADFGLFESCARVLIKRGRTLKYLRPIAETIYQCVTGEIPTDCWAKRQEDEARRKYGTHPPEQSHGCVKD